MLKRLVNVFLWFGLLYSPVYADQYIGNVMASGASEHYTVVVEKIPKKLYLLKIKGDNQEIVDSADILTGRVDGNKMVRGDEKTPEGIYYVTSYMDSDRMHSLYGNYAAIYGSGAYPLNYPNPVDRILKKTGSGIWLHGLNPEKHKPATEGCVAMENVDLDRMKPLLSIKMPVVIVDNASFLDEEEYAAERKRHLDDLAAFMEAWAYGNYEAFEKYIHPRYTSYAAKNASAYLAGKKRLMEAYPERQIKIDNIKVYRQNGDTLVYDFDQFYCAPNLISYGNKRFYLIADGERDKIVSEEMGSKAIQPYLQPYIEAFVEEWRQAWESRDIDGYMKYYGPNFKDRGKWQESKTKLFSDNEVIHVGVENLKWEITGGNTIRLTFTQNYSADSLRDSGLKTMVISGCPDSFVIQSEVWRAH